ncbi:MAG: DNA helicase PcrA [Bacillota bacterium]|jgi:DNA helicase-2/ATP-dependent DNA helicase PcrA|nr:DNA helicase PcrA [Bacillota bacterium]
MSIYDTLNPEQKRAVQHDKGPLLILAGAGSGKTRVLTHRIAYLIEHRDVNPWNILAITFTNKAAREMRERVDQIVGYGSENIWVSTFHSTCVRFLRRYIDRLGYSRSFTIYDTDDQKTLMREVCKYLEIDTKQISERSIISTISKAKDELISPEEFEKSAGGDYKQKILAKAYKEYQKRLKSSNALDFDDLIVKSVELFNNDKEALTYFQNRFRYIMVDEYQDTNTAQFHLIHLLSSGINEHGDKEYNLCVVGDDDQSIYKFRGANIQNILNFEKSFPNTKVIKLEQNYRSTKNILDAANEVISNNVGRKDKSLWTDKDKGDPIIYTLFESDIEEADCITSEIKRTVENDSASYNDFAILYRTNAQSRIFEEKLILRNIPYKIIGGTNFYARKEIKDILAYLKTIDNGLDNIAVKRIINVPRRGIGLTTIDRVNNYSLLNDMSFYEALTRAQQIPGLERTASKIMPFVSMIEGLRSRLNDDNYNLIELIDDILEATGYLRELEAEATEEAKDRIANIDELINKLVSYVEGAEESPSLSGFLEEVALVADIDNLDESTDNIVLMTLHSAKGLEFPYVYICGMEDGIFPSYMSIYADNPQEEIEEERRLCYVGITRAMKCLSLSAAKHRMLRGETQYNKPSRFIHEIPRYLMTMNVPEKEIKNPFSNTSSGFYQTQKNYKPFITPEPKNIPGSNMGTLDYGVGDTVKHIKFGTGRVTDIIMGGKDYEVTVDFARFGTRKLIASFAKLTRID